MNPDFSAAHSTGEEHSAMESLISAAAAAANASGRSWDDGTGGHAEMSPLHPSYRRDGAAISSIRRGATVDAPREDVGGIMGHKIGTANVFLSGHPTGRSRGLAAGDPWRDRVQA
jgi:hypothetical protein